MHCARAPPPRARAPPSDGRPHWSALTGGELPSDLVGCSRLSLLGCCNLFQFVYRPSRVNCVIDLVRSCHFSSFLSFILFIFLSLFLSLAFFLYAFLSFFLYFFLSFFFLAVFSVSLHVFLYSLLPFVLCAFAPCVVVHLQYPRHAQFLIYPQLSIGSTTIARSTASFPETVSPLTLSSTHGGRRGRGDDPFIDLQKSAINSPNYSWQRPRLLSPSPQPAGAAVRRRAGPHYPSLGAAAAAEPLPAHWPPWELRHPTPLHSTPPPRPGSWAAHTSHERTPRAPRCTCGSGRGNSRARHQARGFGAHTWRRLTASELRGLRDTEIYTYRQRDSGVKRRRSCSAV